MWYFDVQMYQLGKERILCLWKGRGIKVKFGNGNSETILSLSVNRLQVFISVSKKT